MGGSRADDVAAAVRVARVLQQRQRVQCSSAGLSVALCRRARTAAGAQPEPLYDGILPVIERLAAEVAPHVA